MKILELRLKNLNSLYGEWVIDFTGPDYVAEGLFAITGPTGAGKTTILDAICLADLFDIFSHQMPSSGDATGKNNAGIIYASRAEGMDRRTVRGRHSANPCPINLHYHRS